MGNILVVDDDYQLRQSFEKLLTEEGHTVCTAATGEEGLAIVRNMQHDLVILDVRLPGIDGLTTFRNIRETEPKIPVIVVTAYSTTETAIEAIKLGAFDYVLKPFDVPDILSVIHQALEVGRFVRSRVEMDLIPRVSAEAIIGQSKAMQEVYKAIGRVAPTDATVLIRGESGTGKELVARAVYQHSLRADKSFSVINCVAIPETLLESELFGYEKGAFSGAASRRTGRIEQAQGGTIFLDEIGDMPFSIQAKILRLLQEKSIERLGGREPIPVDVRIIAATNRDLETALAEDRFRRDLYYRLKVVTIWLPPLRDKQVDVPRLVNYFLIRFAKDMGLVNPGITDEAMAILSHNAWPGNVRELANVIQKALIFSRGYPIQVGDVSQAIGDTSPEQAEVKRANDSILQWVRQGLTTGSDNGLFEGMVDRFASILISEALDMTRGNRSKAAKLLGLSRPTLQAKIEKYRLRVETSVKNGTLQFENE